jgi:predicted deacetylase
VIATSATPRHPPRSATVAAAQARLSLLVSIHDISPLTLEASRRAVDLAVSAGVAHSALTLLVIPRHEDRAPLDEHPPTRDWVRGLVDAGACLCMHGLTHQMVGRARNPWQWALARGFARGQGEFFVCDAAECERRIEAAQLVFKRAGLDGKVRGFVPPAWLLSPAAYGAVKGAGFGFYELFTGIVYAGVARARRLIGFGSLTWAEAFATAGFAGLQSHRSPADTRFAIHPADLERPSSVRAIRANLRRLRGNLEPVNYADFLRLGR